MFEIEETLNLIELHTNNKKERKKSMENSVPILVSFNNDENKS